MAKAIWNGSVVAESSDTIEVEGNTYFPEAAVNHDFLRPSASTSTCPWKGTAHYFTLAVGGKENPDAAWYYPEPKAAAKQIKGRVAFWRGVAVEK
jgi:uncharacterized protein (DUF427 family)